MATQSNRNNVTFTRPTNDSNQNTQNTAQATLQSSTQNGISHPPNSRSNITQVQSLHTSQQAPPVPTARAPVSNRQPRTTIAPTSNAPTARPPQLQANVSTVSHAVRPPPPPPPLPQQISSPPPPPLPLPQQTSHLPPTSSHIQPLNIQSASSSGDTMTLPQPTLLKHRLRQIISRWNNWWLFEILASILSIICLVAIITILAHFDGKSLAEWHSKITPNSMISVLATISKSAVLLPVAECISQLIWLRFQTPHNLQLIQEFDEASRGALGSFQILFSTEAMAAWFGAIITLTSLAFEPFVQQVLLLESRELLLNTTTASVPVSKVFNASWTSSLSLPMNYYPLGIVDEDLDSNIPAACFLGIYSTSITPPYTCGAPICRFKSFTSLAICSSCTDVFKDLKSTHNRNSSTTTYITPKKFSMEAHYLDGSTGEPVFATLFNSTAEHWLNLDMPTVAEFATLKLKMDNDTLVPTSAYECSLRLCIKHWAGASFENSAFKEMLPTVFDFQKVTDATPNQVQPMSVVETDPTLNATSFGVFMVNWKDWMQMADFLAVQFTGRAEEPLFATYGEGFAIMLYLNDDIPAMIDKLADSLTNMIRTSLNSTLELGQSFQKETFIIIQWPWISLPVLVVLSANFLLAIMIVQTWRKQAPVWKSSSLALLWHGLKADSMDTGGAATDLLSEMELLAEQKRVRLNGRGVEDLKFVNA